MYSPRSSLAACLLTALASAPALAAPKASARTHHGPADGKGAFATGRYRNLFVEAGRTPKEVDAKIEAAYQQLFHGDPETRAALLPGRPERERPARLHPRHPAHRRALRGHVLRDDDRRPARQEGRVRRPLELVDDLHVPERTRSTRRYGFFSWQMNYDGTRHGRAARAGRRGVLRHGALLRRQPVGERQGHLRLQGPRRPAARTTWCTASRSRARCASAAGVREHTVGKEVNDEHRMILFSPDERNTFTDASYHLPAFYELWARWGPEEDRAFWARAATRQPRLLREERRPEDRPRPEPRRSSTGRRSASAARAARRSARTPGASR